MREILFRGKNKLSGGWCEGYLVKTGDHFRISTRNDLISFGVDPETVGQYTGLKDKNGKRIFEGDFIHARHVDDSSLTAGVVNFIQGCFCVRCNAYNNPAIDTLEEYEIIGNIHDAPKLFNSEVKADE